MIVEALPLEHNASHCEGHLCMPSKVFMLVLANVQPKDSGAPKTGDMMLGRPVAKFYEAVTTTEQTLF